MIANLEASRWFGEAENVVNRSWVWRCFDQPYRNLMVNSGVRLTSQLFIPCFIVCSYFIDLWEVTKGDCTSAMSKPNVRDSQTSPFGFAFRRYPASLPSPASVSSLRQRSKLQRCLFLCAGKYTLASSCSPSRFFCWLTHRDFVPKIPARYNGVEAPTLSHALKGGASRRSRPLPAASSTHDTF